MRGSSGRFAREPTCRTRGSLARLARRSLERGPGAERAKERQGKERREFVGSGMAAHVHRAISVQRKTDGPRFVAVSRSVEIPAGPDWGALTFHAALNPTIPGRAVGNWLAQ